MPMPPKPSARERMAIMGSKRQDYYKQALLALAVAEDRLAQARMRAAIKSELSLIDQSMNSIRDAADALPILEEVG